MQDQSYGQKIKSQSDHVQQVL